MPRTKSHSVGDLSERRRDLHPIWFPFVPLRCYSLRSVAIVTSARDDLCPAPQRRGFVMHKGTDASPTRQRLRRPLLPIREDREEVPLPGRRQSIPRTSQEQSREARPGHQGIGRKLTPPPKQHSSYRSRPLPQGWPRLRARILRRDNHHCQINGPGCTTHATEVDHIIPAARGGNDQPNNLQATCQHCHQAKTVAENPATTPRARPPEQHPGITG